MLSIKKLKILLILITLTIIVAVYLTWLIANKPF